MNTIRLATEADLPQVIEVHLMAFPGFFLTRMGRPFLALLYRGFMQSASGVFLVACNDDEAATPIVGFVAGTLQPQSFFRCLLRSQWFRFGLVSLWPLLRQPREVGLKLWSALFYRGETLPDLPEAALLSSLAVLPSRHRQGLGRQLVQSFVEQARLRNAPGVYVTTDQGGNIGANSFYVDCGFELAGRCKRPPNRILNRYLLTFRS